MEGMMKQLLLTQKGGPWELVEKPIPKPGRDEVLVKITSTSICNQTDLNSIKALHPPHEVQNHGGLPHHLRIWDHRLEGDPLAKFYNDDMPDLKPYPAPMGHEAMGVVVEVGELEKTPPHRAVKVGDRVCVLCDSTLSQYAICPANVVKVPDGLSDDEGGLWEPWMVAWGPCVNTVKFGDTIAILGQGALGLFATQLARMLGAGTIITSEPIAFKRELSKAFGADVVLDPTTQNITEEIDKLTGGKGVNVCFDFSGAPEAIQNMPYITKCDGTIVQIGALCTPVLIDWGYIHFKGLQVHSSTSAGRMSVHYRSENDVTRALNDMLREKKAGRLHIDRMVTHRPDFSVEGITRIFEEIEKGNVIKAVFNPWKDCE